MSWLLTQLDDILKDPGSEQFGKATLNWQKRLQGLTRSDPVRRRRPGRCIRCPEDERKRALWTRDDGITECGVCGRYYSEEEYQREIVDAQDAIAHPADSFAVRQIR